MASKSKESLCLYLPSTGIVGTLLQAASYTGVKDLKQSSHFHSKSFTYWAIS